MIERSGSTVCQSSVVEGDARRRYSQDSKPRVFPVARSVLGIAIIAVLLGGVNGCGGPAVPSGKVAGKVVSHGSPLDMGYVQLVKADGVPVGAAGISPQGEFQFESSVPVGEYRVAVLPPKEEVPAGAPDPKLEQAAKKIPPKYRNHTTSGFTALVKEGQNTFTFDMP